MEPEELLDGIIRAAEATAQQAQGNDQQDWRNFSQALRRLQEEGEPKRRDR